MTQLDTSRDEAYSQSRRISNPGLWRVSKHKGGARMQSDATAIVTRFAFQENLIAGDILRNLRTVPDKKVVNNLSRCYTC
jgi:hypothetical protein